MKKNLTLCGQSWTIDDMKKELLSTLRKELEKYGGNKSWSKLAGELGIPRTTLRRLVQTGGSGVAIRTWEKIERFYRKKAA